jgi:hypothetical protein
VVTNVACLSWEVSDVVAGLLACWAAGCGVCLVERVGAVKYRRRAGAREILGYE